MKQLPPADFIAAVKFDDNGLVAAVAQDARDGLVLMVAEIPLTVKTAPVRT